jgi:hypothetical protein
MRYAYCSRSQTVDARHFIGASRRRRLGSSPRRNHAPQLIYVQPEPLCSRTHITILDARACVRCGLHWLCLAAQRAGLCAEAEAEALTLDAWLAEPIDVLWHLKDSPTCSVSVLQSSNGKQYALPVLDSAVRVTPPLEGHITRQSSGDYSAFYGLAVIPHHLCRVYDATRNASKLLQMYVRCELPRQLRLTEAGAAG